MAYPTVDKPYGLKPINLIGGQVFAGSTRMYNITYAYATDIFYGDFVALVRGNLERISVSTGTVGTLVGTGWLALPPVIALLMFATTRIRCFKRLFARPQPLLLLALAP
jgi:hypothetical protein